MGLASLPTTSGDSRRLADALLDILQTAAARDLGDFFVYRVGEPSMDLNAAPLGGSRYPVDALLDGRSFAKFRLDVGIGDAQNGPAEMIAPRDWLGFAAIPAPSFTSISREDHFAQKLHAYTLPREGEGNTRVKDLIDLVLLMDSGSLDFERLRDALRDTFARRATHQLPTTLEPPPNFWNPVFRRLAEECGINSDIDSQFDRFQQFFNAHISS